MPRLQSTHFDRLIQYLIMLVCKRPFIAFWTILILHKFKLSICDLYSPLFGLVQFRIGVFLWMSKTCARLCLVSWVSLWLLRFH